MTTATFTRISLGGGAVLAIGACSLGAFDGYASGGTSTHGASTSTGHGGSAQSSSSGQGATGGAGTSTSSSATSSSSSSSSSGGGTGGMTPCTQCGASCVDTTSDAGNCGACGVTCAAGYKCAASVCDNVVVSVSSFLATCAVLHGGEVWCWGRDVWGEIGIAPTDPGNTTCYMGDRCRTTPTKITTGLPAPATDPAVEIAAGREATCARTRSGAVYCWGSNEAGMLGYLTPGICTKGTSTSATGPCSATPQLVGLPAGTIATQISLGTVTACALTSTNDVYCWGSNWSAEEQMAPSQTLVMKPALMASGVAQVSVGTDVPGTHDAVCIRLMGSGDVQCWGASAGATLFPATSSGACSAGGDDFCTPTKTTVPTVFQPNSGVAITADALAMGAAVGMALQGTNAMVWGSDPFGQGGFGLAASPGSNHFDVRMLPDLPAIKAIANGGLTTLLLDTSGAVWALGWSDNGQIGNGMFMNGNCPLNNGQQCKDKPLQIPTLSGVTQIFSGIFNSAAITQGGKLWMWGTNYEASLGHAPSVAIDGTCPGSAIACSPTPALVTVVP